MAKVDALFRGLRIALYTAAFLQLLAVTHAADESASAKQPRLTGAQQVELATADKLDRQARELSELGKYQHAASISEQALQIREKTLGPEHRETAINLTSLALLYRSLGDYTAAEPLFQRALTSCEKMVGSNHPETAICINNLALLYSSQGKYAAAEPLYRRALMIQEAVLGTEHPDTANSVNNLATLYHSQANYSAAEPLFKRAFRIREKQQGRNHPDTATSLSNLAELYHSQADYASAISHHRQALEIREKILEPGHPHITYSLNNLAVVYYSQGNYVAALRYFQQIADTQEQRDHTGTPFTASALYNLGTLYLNMGNMKEAEPRLRRASKIRETVLGPEHPDTVRSIVSLAMVMELNGEGTRAEQMFLEALKIREKVFGSDHPDTAFSLELLASLYRSQGNYFAAEPLYVRSLKILEEVFGEMHPRTANSLRKLAELQHSHGDIAAAEPLYQRAMKIHEDFLGPEHPETCISLDNLAVLYCLQSEFVRATPLIHRSRQGQRAHVTRVLPMLSAPDQQAFLQTYHTGSVYFGLSVGLCQANDSDSTTLSASWLVNGKGVAQEALAQRNLQTRDIDDPKNGPVVKELLSVRSQLASVAMNAAEPGQEEERRAELDRLTAQEQQLSSQLGGSASTTSEWIEMTQIQEALPKDGVLIDIARFDIYDFKAKGKEPKWKPAHYAAWITSPSADSKTVLVDLGDAESIDQLVGKVRQQIAADAGKEGAIAKGGEDTAVATLTKDMSALSDLIWKPLAPHVGDAKQIVLSPDGALWLAPWSALPANDAGDEYLLERYNIRLIISGRDLVAKPDGRTTTAPVILANPSFDQKESEKESAIEGIFKALPPESDNATRSFSAQSTLPKVQPLPNTGVEALAIQPHIESYTRQKAGLYKEQYALERVAKSLNNPQIATFATHGFFLPTQETKLEDRSLAMSDSTRSVAVDTNGQLIENPLLRCGLLLSGCNNRGASVADDDGILTGMEIVSIDFRGTELVVLSACETGIGDVKNGEGVAGLRQAFQLAGAEAVVSTLWQVPDRDSALLMSKFFEELAGGKTKSEALRSAQLERIEKRRERYGAAHPFFWAAFTLTGQ